MINVYSVLDRVTGLYGKPWYFVAPVSGVQHEDAGRWFGSALKIIPAEANRTAADYALYHIGTFNEMTGCLVGESKPFFIACPGEGLSNLEGHKVDPQIMLKLDGG